MTAKGLNKVGKPTHTFISKLLGKFRHNSEKKSTIKLKIPVNISHFIKSPRYRKVEEKKNRKKKRTEQIKLNEAIF